MRSFVRPSLVYIRSPDEKGELYMIEKNEDIRANELHWYALRTYYTHTKQVKEIAQRDGVECFYPIRMVEKMDGLTLLTREESVIPSLLFIKSTETYLKRLRTKSTIAVSVYTNPGSKLPAIISDREMEIFMFVTRTGCKTLEAVDKELVKGDKVRVTGGVFKGAEGYIVRVHGTKRLVVQIKGVAAIATTYIPKCFIDKI